MSKRTGNFYTIRDLLNKGFDPAAIRLELIKTHYRSNANFSLQGLHDSTKRIERWRRHVRRLMLDHQSEPKRSPSTTIADIVYKHVPTREFVRALSLDLNIQGAIAELDKCARGVETHEHLMERQADLGFGETTLPELLDAPLPLESLHNLLYGEFGAELALFHLADHILGVIFRPTRDESVDPKADELRLARDAARKAKNWSESDRLRDELVALGYEVKDTPGGTVVTKKATL
jgi:cysteinyl-tRNA synthetase